jgi:hypothetical protein
VRDISSAIAQRGAEDAASSRVRMSRTRCICPIGTLENQGRGRTAVLKCIMDVRNAASEDAWGAGSCNACPCHFSVLVTWGQLKKEMKSPQYWRP